MLLQGYLDECDRIDDAIVVFKEALASARGVHGPVHSDVADTLFNMAVRECAGVAS